MKQHDNDDEPISFVSLAALTANVLQYLKLNQQEDAGSNNESTASNERNRKALEQREFVRLRLSEIERFEDRSRRKGR